MRPRISMPLLEFSQQATVEPWEQVGGGGLPLGRAVAARAMERAATMDVNCILTECLEDESLESFGSFGRLFGR